jgi:dolichol kinase
MATPEQNWKHRHDGFHCIRIEGDNFRNCIMIDFCPLEQTTRTIAPDESLSHLNCSSLNGNRHVDEGPERDLRCEQPADSETAFNEISRHEMQRRIWHMLPGLLPFVLLGVSLDDPLSITVLGSTFTLVVGISALVLLRQHLLARRGESSLGPAVLGYSGTILTMLVMFRSQAELGFSVATIIAFGDGTATLAGWRLGGKPLPWNRKKTWTGFCAFLIAALPAAVVIYWALSNPSVSFALALACTVPAVVAGALAESVRSHINDNLRVGVAAGLTIVAAHAMFVGW